MNSTSRGDHSQGRLTIVDHRVAAGKVQVRTAYGPVKPTLPILPLEITGTYLQCPRAPAALTALTALERATIMGPGSESRRLVSSVWSVMGAG